MLTIEQGRRPGRAGDYYRDEVLPALAERLDRAFPEFGWRRDRWGWIATNRQFTKSRFGARPGRVVAHGHAPSGFLVHGSGSIPWTVYVNGGTWPRGRDFIRAVREVAERAGVDTAPLDRPQPRDRCAELLRDFFELCQRELASERGVVARAYLERRGFLREAIAESGLGLVPSSAQTGQLLERIGYRPSEIAAASVLADSRWPGRLCGAWRDAHGRIGTLWARSIGNRDAASRYLYLRGARRGELPPYGLSDLLRGKSDTRRDIVLVEGFLDLHQLRARGIANGAALGGTSISVRTFERLHDLGIESVTLCLDNDRSGRRGTAQAIEHAARARNSPHIYAVDPALLAPANDPDELIRDRGSAAWHQLLQARTCGIAWHARQLAAVTHEASDLQRRSGLRRAGRWLGTLPPRLALEQEDAVRLVAEQCGYSAEAALRAFRERYWSRAPQRRQPVRSRDEDRTVGLER